MEENEPQKHCFFCRCLVEIKEIRNFAALLYHFGARKQCKLFINHSQSITTMMNQYETVFILTPVLSDVQMKETVEKFKGILAEQGAEIINEENWGLKKMAYAIDKKSTGFYQLLEFKAEPHVVEKLEVGFRRDERVIRFLTVKLDKFAAAYAEKRRSNKKEA